MKVVIVVAAKYFGQNFKNDWVEVCNPNCQSVLFMVETVKGGFKYRDTFNDIKTKICGVFEKMFTVQFEALIYS